MTQDKKPDRKGFRVYVKPQTFSDCFIATMDPKDPLKICLYPSVKSHMNVVNDDEQTPDEELEQLLLHNYLILKRNCIHNR